MPNHRKIIAKKETFHIRWYILERSAKNFQTTSMEYRYFIRFCCYCGGSCCCLKATKSLQTEHRAIFHPNGKNNARKKKYFFQHCHRYCIDDLSILICWRTSAVVENFTILLLVKLIHGCLILKCKMENEQPNVVLFNEHVFSKFHGQKYARFSSTSPSFNDLHFFGKMFQFFKKLYQYIWLPERLFDWEHFECYLDNIVKH